MLEISQLDIAKGHEVSYSMAVLIFMSTFLFLLIPVHYFKYRKEGVIETKYLTEIYDGFKENAASKLFVFIFIAKRFLMASVLVFMRNANVWVKNILFALIQIVALIYTIMVRPFEKSKENTLEIINAITMTVLCFVIVVCNDESMWFSSLDTIIIFSLMLTGLFIGAVVTIDAVIGCIQKCCKRRNKTRAQTYLENDEQQMEYVRRSIQEESLHQESEPGHNYFETQNQNICNNNHPHYSNIQHENPDENQNSTRKRR